MKAHYLRYILFLLVLSCTKERDFTNPYDSSTPSEGWAPSELTILQNGKTLELKWDQLEERIDGFVIDRKIEGYEWEEGYDEVKGDSTFWIDYQIPDSIELGDSVYYSVKAKAGKNLSDQTRKSIAFNYNFANHIRDIEGNSYKTVRIGSQTWMAENLRVTKYADGTPLNEVTSDGEWAALKNTNDERAYSYYNNNIDNEKFKYGALYTYGAAVNGAPQNGTNYIQGICPDGWHLPSDEEWKVLERNLGMSNSEIDLFTKRGNNLGTRLKARNGWELFNTSTMNYNGTDNFQFTAFPSSIRNEVNGEFDNYEGKAYFWTSSVYESHDRAIFRGLQGLSIWITREHYPKSGGFSVRCVEGEGVSPTYTLPEVRTFATEQVYAKVAIVEGDVISNGEAEIIVRGIVLSLDANFADTTQWKAETLGVDTFEVVLPELAPETTYYYKAYAANVMGTAFGDMKSFTTPAFYGEVSDVDGNSYKTVSIGTQVWMAENLRVAKYADGTEIPLVENNTDWANLTDNNDAKAYGFYSNQEADKINYGAFYTYAAAVNGIQPIGDIKLQGVCPDGWHLPGDDEWKQLELQLGMQQNQLNATGYRGTDQGEQLKAVTGWNTNHNGADEFGFKAMSSGIRSNSNGFPSQAGQAAYWWTSTENNTSYGIYRSIYTNTQMNRSYIQKSTGLSVRCLKGEGKNPNYTVPEVESLEAKDITSYTAKIGGKVLRFGDAPVTSWGIEYATDENFTSVLKAPATLNETDTFTVQLSALDFDVTYYYRTYAQNFKGKAYGEVKSFTTVTIHTYGELADIDGNKYKTIKIGEQEWMAENLKATRYSDGAALKLIEDNVSWANIPDIKADKAYSYYNNNDNNEKDAYGALYTYEGAVNSTLQGFTNKVQGICPDGWHLPTTQEWNALSTYLGTTVAGTKMKTKVNWSNNSTGTNVSGFSGMAGGYRHPTTGNSQYELQQGWWWGSDLNSNAGYCFYLSYNNAILSASSFNISGGLSVRCIKGDGDLPTYSAPAVTTTAAFNLLDGGAKIQSEVTSNGNTKILEHGIEYSTTQGFATGTKVSASFAGVDTFTVELTGLSPETTYYYKAYASNKEGVEYSQEFTFTTKRHIEYGTLTDIEGNAYKIVQIGSQEWMAENLRSTKYADGTEIPHISENAGWAALADNNVDKGYSIYNNNTNGEKETYGAVYSYAAAVNGLPQSGDKVIQGVCPQGWHVPSSSEWLALGTYLETNMPTADVWNILQSEDWPADNGASNDYGFSGLPSASRNYSNGSFSLPTQAVWFSSNEYGLNAVEGQILQSNNYVHTTTIFKSFGAAVRCLKGEGISPSLPVITTESVISVDFTTAEIGGDITSDGGYDIIEQGIVYSTTPNFSTGTKVLATTNALGKYVVSITGLSAETSYYYKSFVKTLYGESFGEELEFSTAARFNYGSVSDVDGNTYKTVSIGDQEWMAENLRVTQYADGTNIEYVESADDWLIRLSYDSKAYCNYGNYDGEGVLYTQAAATNGISLINNASIQGACPTGWHLPSDDEWKMVLDTLGANNLKSEVEWEDDGNGSNAFGFNALPYGYIDYFGGFEGLGQNAFYWTSTAISGQSAWYRSLSSSVADVNRGSSEKTNGYSIRCVKGTGVTSTIPLIQTLGFKDQSSSFVTLEGNVTNTGGEDITEQGFEYSTSPNFTNGTKVLHTTNGLNVYSLKLDNLSAETTYYFKAFVTNANGTAYGDEMSFKTVPEGASVVDIDGNVYTAVTIGPQVWMAENLKVTKYPDGSAIPQVTGGEDWKALGKNDEADAFCYVDNDPGSIYGVLYTYAAAIGDNWAKDNTAEQGICPDGWHLPSDEEWKVLERTIGMSDYQSNIDGGSRGTNEGEKLKSTEEWQVSDSGTDIYGFSALPGGMRGAFSGGFQKNSAYFWTSTTSTLEDAYYRLINGYNHQIYRGPFWKNDGRSVRCVKN